MVRPVSENSREIYDYLLDNVRAKYGNRIRHVILFGSRAKGTEKPWSDYDFLIILDRKDRAVVDGIYDIVTDALSRFGADISLKIYSEKDFEAKKTEKQPFINRIVESGIELWK